MSGHTEAVSSIQWTSPDEIMSGGWDHCIRLWDVQTGVNKETLVSFGSLQLFMPYDKAILKNVSRAANMLLFIFVCSRAVSPTDQYECHSNSPSSTNRSINQSINQSFNQYHSTNKAVNHFFFFYTLLMDAGKIFAYGAVSRSFLSV